LEKIESQAPEAVVIGKGSKQNGRRGKPRRPLWGVFQELLHWPSAVR